MKKVDAAIFTLHLNRRHDRAALAALPSLIVQALALHYFRLYLKAYDHPNPYRLDWLDRKLWERQHGPIPDTIWESKSDGQPILCKAEWYQWELLRRITSGQLPKTRRNAWIVSGFKSAREIPLAA